MTSGSLNQLLHEENPSPEIVWPLRFRILYEIALGVNFLHNLTPPLLHHDLKTPNILLDNEFHVKIADFGLSKWRMLSQSLSDQKPAGGTIIYMPPEMYRPSGTNCRGNVKHDMYSYAIIMWEVLSRKQPFEGAVDQMQIMYSVSIGDRPDTSERSLPADIPHRDVFVSIMQSGWACDPNERPAFLKCLLDLEPVIRRYDDISILEGILKIKRVRNQILSISQNISVTSDSATTTLPMTESTPQSINPSPSSPDIYLEKISIHPSGPPTRHSGYESPVVSLPFRPCSDSLLVATPFETYGPQAGPSCTLTWVQSKRDQIVMKMTEACLNQCLDSLIARSVIIKEDYELIKSRSTRSEKVRKLIDTCDSKGELFAKIIVQKLKDNRQSDLQPFPEI
ncbi:receptor-interacting serine/threonine-protein kinase 2 isoform X2 [Hyperolius riggenbachi]